MALWLISACTPTPQPIEFGTDACAHCKMTIVDKPFSAEAVTTKGKVYKFDAIECMVDFIKEKEETEYAHLLVRDYLSPSEWQDARQCSYLISQNLPSPMGAFLSAYKNPAGANQLQQQKSGEVYDWQGLKNQLKR
jgi:copper chaperone NosL